jgi:predicted RNA-binding protein YlxR (DUF448 family)
MKADRPRHVPTRMCLVCRQKSGKRQLTRIVRTADGVVVDPSGKMNGRGAYLCDQASCWERAMNTEVVAKALKTSLSDDDRARLRAHQPPDGSL